MQPFGGRGLVGRPAGRRVVLGLGANVASEWGSPAATLRRALQELQAAGVRPLACSRLYESLPVGGVAQPTFRNAVVIVSTDLAPGRLLALLKGLERRAGRRQGLRWGPRPLDLDILDDPGRQLGWRRPLRSAQAGAGCKRRRSSPYGRLILPHAQLHARAFVLAPLRDVAPHWQHPIQRRPVARLLSGQPPGAGSRAAGVRVALENWP